MHTQRLVLVLSVVVGAVGPQVAAGDTLGAYIGNPMDGAVFGHGSTMNVGGCAWGSGDHTICYRWIFGDTMETVTGEVQGMDQQFEVAVPAPPHACTVKGQDMSVILEVWWKKDSPATAISVTHHFSVVGITITSATVAQAGSGAPNSRTDIGIGELVDCSVSLDPEIPGALASWEVTGRGWPKTYDARTLPMQADYAAGTCTVTVRVGANCSATKDFTVVAPEGIRTEHANDRTIGTGGHDWMGTYSRFERWVLPENVSFGKAYFREDKDDVSFTWPDRTRYEYRWPEGDGPGDRNSAVLVLDNNRWWAYDRVADDYHVPNPPSRLDGGGPDPFVWQRNVRQQYWTGEEWANCSDPDYRVCEYRYLPPPQGTARCGIRTAAGEVFGSWMGPYSGTPPQD